MIGNASRPKDSLWQKVRRASLRPAIAELQSALEVVETNAPINEREGDKGQAKLERTNARSYRAAMDILRKV